jgi:hypothetical protein
MVPQYWASFGVRVSGEKAPALAQLFGKQSAFLLLDRLDL